MKPLAIVGELVGAVLGYAGSFFFQNELIRAKLGMGGYFQHIGDVLTSFGNKGDAQIAIIGWVGILVGCIVGGVIGSKLSSK